LDKRNYKVSWRFEKIYWIRKKRRLLNPR
jgi:hypothetical protein